ncbi:MAG: serine/threonine protein kinase [Deltaproteobacteria bacterium]|nr:serine/threonine protein kinase [Deltaproteobacteria bacterium]
MAVVDDPLIGQVLDGRFEILGPLGRGGMGTVYRAKQRSIDREIALKLIDRRFEGDPTAVKRFLREAKLASQLSHPNIVSVVDFGQTADGRLYIAMELLHGRTLHEELTKHGALPRARVVRYATQIIDALETAHAHSIVHRDLKLENVMLLDAPGDLLKLLDFGLARSFTDPDARATEAGQLAGTPRYLAPEVIEGAEPAPAQDIYALGVMLVELATTRSPFDAPTLEGLFMNKAAGTMQLAGLDPELQPIVKRMLAVSPGARPTHAQIRAALGRLDPQASSGGPPAIGITTDPTLPALASEAFAPPVVDTPIELEREWAHEKAHKQATATLAKPPRRSKAWIFVAIGLVVAGLVTAGVIVQMNAKTKEVVTRDLGGTVGIQIRANPRALIMMDGHKVGWTPLTIHVKKSSSQLKLDAIINGQTRSKLVVPDQDQDVAFTATE